LSTNAEKEPIISITAHESKPCLNFDANKDPEVSTAARKFYERPSFILEKNDYVP